jgi:hypothetical protein
MLARSSVKLSLLLPVFQGGSLFLGAIQSIEDSYIPFEKIIISFNGADPADYKEFLAIKAAGKLKKQYLVYRTMEDLTAAQHGQFVLSNLSGLFDSDSSIMLLAHDDRLLSRAEDEKVLLEYISQVQRGVVYFPSYQCCLAGDYDNITHVHERNVTYTPDDFFWLTMRESVPTNMSGMIVPFQAWVDALKFVAKMQTGARFEHMLCIGRSVGCISFTNKMKTIIGERQNSDGKLLSDLDHRKAALDYVLAYYKNGHLNSAKRYPQFIYQLIRKVVAYVIANKKIDGRKLIRQ